MVLDLFNGQLSINDILNLDMAYIKELCNARNKLLEEREKQKQEMIENSSKT